MDQGVAALLAAGVSLVVGSGSGTVTVWLFRERLRTEHMAEAAINRLLKHAEWPYRSLDRIRKEIGGFDDTELRRLLVRSGAVRLPNDPELGEVWGLVKRNKDALA
ncbi:hypothetical protein OG912_38135 (plasmid) [Streptomyces sp. NBC_00464]|uniref:hypothetical protein n=1 Tax=Streptomyces sp. NBC_00464 TaxID=2975751 RepID=UPI002E1763E5